MKAGKQLLAAMVLAAVQATAGAACNSAIPATTPSADFSEDGGTVLHKPSGLVWMRCALGQTWSGGTCGGSATAYTWQQALQAAKTLNDGAGYAGKVDWRLPNIKELQSIVEEGCYSPSINSSIFPNTDASVFWSASASAYDSGLAWYVIFSNGYAGSYYKNGYNQVRLVRAGQ